MSYRFTIQPKDGEPLSFTADRPTQALSRVWNDVPEGLTTVVVEGLDASGKVVGQAGERTFYRSPEPGAASFVEIGDRVKRDQVLCIIEAMKLMNEIKSDFEGEITNIYVENGQPVQYGERLFAIRP